MRLYAERTKVTIAESVAELHKLAARYEVCGFDVDRWADGSGTVRLRVAGRPLAIQVESAPDRTGDPVAHRDECRRRWRALVLLFKARFEAAAAGITTLEREFSTELELARRPGGPR